MSELYQDMKRPFLIGTEQGDMEVHVEVINRPRYDAIPQKDPMTLYVIKETGDVYKGEIPMIAVGRSPGEPKMYLHINKTGDRVVYCISEFNPPTNRMIPICEYTDPQAALDYLQRKTPTIDQDTEYLIWVTLTTARHNPDRPLYSVVASIIASFLGPVRSSSALQKLLVLLINVPDARTPYKITENHQSRKVLNDIWEYRLYSEIYNFIELNCLYERGFERVEDEEAWLKKISGQLYAKLVEKFSVSLR